MNNLALIRSLFFFLIMGLGAWLVFSGYSDPVVYNENIYGWLSLLGFVLFVSGIVGLLIQMVGAFPKKDI